MPLRNLDHVHENNSLNEDEVIDIFFQTLTMLKHLHSRQVAYRDLKPANILIKCQSPLHLRFANFGFVNGQLDSKAFSGTEQYAAPERYLEESYTTPVDLWSLGVIILEYMYGSPTQPQKIQKRKRCMSTQSVQKKQKLA